MQRCIKTLSLLLGAMKQSRGTCFTFQSFLVILPNVPARTTFIELYMLTLHLNVPTYLVAHSIPWPCFTTPLLFISNPLIPTSRSGNIGWYFIFFHHHSFTCTHLNTYFQYQSIPCHAFIDCHIVCSNIFYDELNYKI